MNGKINFRTDVDRCPQKPKFIEEKGETSYSKVFFS